MAAQVNNSHATDTTAAEPRRQQSQVQMPPAVRNILLAVLALLVAGSFYLLAVRGDALLADLSAIAALICG